MLSKNINKQCVGKALRQARKELLIGRTIVAKMLGVSRRDIMSFEMGRKIIPKEIMTVIFKSAISEIKLSDIIKQFENK